MKIPLNWVQEFTKIEINPKELCDLISLKLSEVEGLEKSKSNDTIIEIENKALTHRGDCFSIEGIAREISALTKTPFRIPKYNLTENVTKSSNISISVEDTSDCPRYFAVKVTGIKVESSPKEIQTRLIDCGVQPINNIVDFTNYAMLETGQPLHSFDAKKLSTKDGKYNLGVRRAKKGENLETLDNVKRELSTENLIITSHDKPVALAGVMGGKDTEIDESTTEIILEAANFTNFTTRKSSRVAGLRTEASLRFEKNLDPNTADRGVGRFLFLISKYNAGKAEEIHDFYPKKQTPIVIETTTDFVNKGLGSNLNLDEISNILTSLSFKVEAENSHFKITVPTFRKDISIKEDLSEEIARIYGYERISPKLPTKNLEPTMLDPKLEFLRKIKENLKVLGYSEVYSYSFVGEELCKKADLDIKNLLEIINPISPQLKFIRDSLLPSMLEKVELNKNNFSNFKLFEVGKEIHRSLSKTELPEAALPNELYTLCTAYYSKDQIDVETLYRKARGDIEEMVRKFNVPKTFKTQVHIRPNLVMYEINLEELFSESPKHKKEIKEIPLFPPIIESISFYLKKESRVGNIIEKIKGLSNLIAEVEVEDIYTAEGEKSITLKINYQDPKKSLSDQTISPIREKIISLLESDLGLKVRK